MTSSTSTKHISYSHFLAMGEHRGFKIPVTRYKTHCNKQVGSEEIDNENPTCEDCIVSATWEEIDNRAEEVNHALDQA